MARKGLEWIRPFCAIGGKCWFDTYDAHHSMTPTTGARTPPQPTAWAEVGDRCFARRYEPYDVTVGVVVGDDGLLVIDTLSGPAQAAQLRADLADLSDRPVRWVVNTHWHFDHCFGNSEFGDATVYGHETVPAALAARADDVRREVSAQAPELAAELAAVTVVPPDAVLASVRMVDIGGRMVELAHPGRGHTDGDLIVRVPDADVLYAGDLVEESGPPAYGDDCFPLEWPSALDFVSGLLTDHTAVMPGHGAVVDTEFVRAQRDDIARIGDTIRQLVESGVSVATAPTAATWPIPVEQLGHAIERGYAALDGPVENRKNLPLA